MEPQAERQGGHVDVAAVRPKRHRRRPRQKSRSLRTARDPGPAGEGVSRLARSGMPQAMAGAAALARILACAKMAIKSIKL